MELVTYHFSGALTFAHTTTAIEQFTQYLNNTSASGKNAVAIDLAQVTEVDSSTLALLLAALRLGNQLQKLLYFHNWPANLVSLAQLYGVFELFTTSSEPSESIAPAR